MKRLLRRLGAALLVILVLLLTVPLIVPIPPLEGTVPPRQLADPDSQFVTLNGIDVHLKTAGSGGPAIVLLHGFAASTFSWREVLAPLAEHGTVIAYDRPAFGLTERPLPGSWTGESPYGTKAQADLVIALLDHYGVEQAILVGNSAGGTIAALVALEHPERVQALVLVDPAIYTGGGSPAWLRPLLNTPQLRRIGPYFVRAISTSGLDLARRSWHDPTRITPDILAGYTKPLQAENWDVGLWEMTAASRQPALDQRLSELTLPVLVITGDDDRIVPTAESVRLAGELPNAELVVVPQCGHVPHEECPRAFLDAVEAFLQRVP